MRKSLREAVEMNFKDFDLAGSRGALIAEGKRIKAVMMIIIICHA